MTNEFMAVELDVRPVERWLDDVHNRAVRRAIPSALNRTVKSVSSKVGKELSSLTGMTQRDVKALLPTVLARTGMNTAYIKSKGRHRTPNLIRFKARQTKKHLSARAFGKTLQYPDGFIGNKGRTAFKRTGKSAHPIEPLYGANPVRAFASDKHMPKFVRHANTTIAKEYDRSLAFYLAKIRA